VSGPKVGVPENIIEGFMRSHQITKKDLFEKIEEKGKFYCFKKLAKTKSNLEIALDALKKLEADEMQALLNQLNLVSINQELAEAA